MIKTKSMLLRLAEMLIPIALCAALILTAFFSIASISDLQGNARVINYTGIVRGATQRVIKKELNHVPDDELIRKLDRILSGLSNGSDEFDLIELESEEYQSLIDEMQRDWADIKGEIYNYRNGAADSVLYEMSEDYFELADKTVLKAEQYSEQTVQSTRKALIAMNVVFIVIAAGCTIFTFYEEKRLIRISDENKLNNEHLNTRMQALLAPMNEISELLYVADMDTHELLFLNEAGKKMLNIQDGAEHLMCYKVLQGLDAPCSFCTNSLLKTDENYSWEYTNPIAKRHYLLKDRMIEWEGRMARMELAFDITEANEEKNELKRHLERDNVLVECIRELYNNHDVKGAITSALEKTGQLFSAERAYIFLFRGNQFSSIVEWRRDGVKTQLYDLKNISQSGCRAWFDAIEKKENVIIDNVEDIKEDMPQGYKILKEQKINNIIWVPCEKSGDLNGCVGLDNHALDMSGTAVPFLQTLQYFITLAMQRNEDEQSLFELSYLDKLTLFYNRNRYMSDVDALESVNGAAGAIYLDVNGLKEINDCFGHDTGDKTLRQCADIIRDTFDSASFYRIGGDEFVIICADVDEETFYDDVDRLKNEFQHNECWVAIGSKWGESCKDIEDIIKNADELMYDDKKRFYQDHPTTSRYRHNNEMLHFLANVNVLREKIRSNNFRVYLQAKMDIEVGKIVGAEALVRYQDENGVIYLPDKFISVLEGSHLISKIDYYVFEEVCKTLLEWRNSGHAVFVVSSNFSRNTFMDENFLKRLEEISDKYEVPRALLEIEITESAGFANVNALESIINKIRKAGFRVSVDDFGVESSNLALLSITEFDVLKIDKRFVKNIMNNSNARLIVEMMVNICAKMNIQLVAEGVETNEQLNTLKDCGVKVVQGFLFSKPRPIESYEI